MQHVVIVIHLMLVLALIGVVLLQKSEGGGLGIGGSGGGGFMSSRGTANLLTRATAVLAGLFFVTSLILSILAGLNRKPTRIDRMRLVTKNRPARTAVARVSKLAVPRLLMNPPPPLPPMPSPPPSDFCSSTTPIKASTNIRWITITTCCIRSQSVQTGRSGLPAQTALREIYRNSPRSLHDRPRLFHPRRG